MEYVIFANELKSPPRNKVLIMVRRAPFGRILKNDYPSLLMLIFIGVIWALAIAGGVFGLLPKHRGGGTFEVDSTTMIILLLIAVVVTTIFGWLTLKRIGDIKRIISSGPEVNGCVQSISFIKDRGRVEYEYEYNGQSHHAGNAIWKNRETIKIQEGDEVVLIIDPEKPSRAFIASLYSDTTER